MSERLYSNYQFVPFSTQVLKYLALILKKSPCYDFFNKIVWIQRFVPTFSFIQKLYIDSLLDKLKNIHIFENFKIVEFCLVSAFLGNVRIFYIYWKCMSQQVFCEHSMIWPLHFTLEGCTNEHFVKGRHSILLNTVVCWTQ